MASADSSISLLATSDVLYDHVCGPCHAGGNIKEAKQYCKECSEYLCDFCVEYHPKIPALKNHKIVSADTVSADSVQRLTVYCGCNKNRDVAFFCEDHTDVICGPCKDVKHHNCQTPTIQQKSSGYTSSNLESIISKTKSLKVKYEQLKQECSDNVEELKRSTENCKKEIKAFRKELDQFLDKLEQSMLAELEQSVSKEQQRIDRQIMALTSALQMLETDCQMLSDAKNDGRKYVMFTADIQTSESLQSYDRRFADLERDAQNLDISFEKNATLDEVRTDNLGTLKISEKKFKQKSNRVLLGQQIESHRKVSVRLADDMNNPRITGCVVMYNDSIVISDHVNCKLKLLDSSLVVTDSFVVPPRPWDVSVLNTNNVIVTIPGNKQLQEVQVFPQLKVGRVIQLDKRCYGVEVSGDKIYVSCNNAPGDGEVRVLDKQGNLERRLGVNKDGSFMFSGPYYIAVSRGGNKIFVSDYSNRTITCMTVNGSILYQYIDKDMRSPEALYCDDSDNILVCCRDSHTVKVITAEGKLSNTILSSKDGLQKPFSVTYRQVDNIIVVGCHELDHLLVYHLKQ